MIPIAPAGNIPKSITVKGSSLASLSMGRNVIATVLSRPSQGLALVSMFGAKVMVETTMELEKGQVLNLKVHETQPRVVLKPVETESMPKAKMEALLENLTRGLEKGDLRSFRVQDLLHRLVSSPQRDLMDPAMLNAFLKEVIQYPSGLAFFLVPFLDPDGRGLARGVICRDDDAGYVIDFHVETDHLGMIGIRILAGDGIDVEIQTIDDGVADHIRSHLKMLYDRLVDFGIRRLEVVKGYPAEGMSEGVDLLV
ncbi:MAG: hypothetical protein U9P80_08885 [Thermodesulfobacteriota bacterium]|nr:hypothetical protein [Thermodesulfobacteriota bacterium]